MTRVFIDTNVLFPFSLMDLNLSLAADYVHDLVWSDRFLDECRRVIVREGHRTAEAAERIAEYIRVGFAESRIPAERYKDLLDELDGPDPDLCALLERQPAEVLTTVRSMAMRKKRPPPDSRVGGTAVCAERCLV